MREIIQPEDTLKASMNRKDVNDAKRVKLEFAPMEGITGYVFRQAHAAIYGGVDRYYSPFIAPGSSHRLTSREKNDILPEHNQGLCLIPQVLTHSAEDFLWVCEELADYGYGTVNLNLGCPSGTVVTKKKGAGFLADLDDLNLFLEEVCNGLEKIHTADGKPMRLSIKTRLGMEEEAEFPRLLVIYNHYPLEELIVHPRVREDYYKGKTRMESFRYALEQSRCPVSYNGNLFSATDAVALMEEIVRQDEASDSGETQKKAKLAALMFGRGAVASPWIFGEVRNLVSALEQGAEEQGAGKREQVGVGTDTDGCVQQADTKKTEKTESAENGACSQLFSVSAHLDAFQQFHDRLLTGYAEIMSGDRNTLFKMKELWYYFQCHFPGCEKELKKIKKAQKLSDYRAAVQAMFASGQFVEDGFTDK